MSSEDRPAIGFGNALLQLQVRYGHDDLGNSSFIITQNSRNARARSGKRRASDAEL
jgi:hypothetical protein